MQTILNKSKHNIIDMGCLFILVSTLIFVILGDKTILDLQITVIIQIAMCLLSCVYFCYLVNNNKNHTLSLIMLSSLILISMTTFSSTYYDDCNGITLLDNGVDISRNDCINYTIENPDTTGAELVNHFKQNVKEKEITSVLERQLEP